MNTAPYRTEMTFVANEADRAALEDGLNAYNRMASSRRRDVHPLQAPAVTPPEQCVSRDYEHAPFVPLTRRHATASPERSSRMGSWSKQELMLEPQTARSSP